MALVTVAFWAVKSFGAHGILWIDGVEKEYYLLLFSFTAVVPAGYIALIFIDKLLTNVKRDIIFEASTTKYLDVIGCACAYASTVGVISAIAGAFIGIDKPDVIIALLLVLSMGEIFMALILKVMKKVFAKAIELKEENDLTI
ncbi:MAG: DUF2975 domain-containing protein [Eubacterium sp.]